MTKARDLASNSSGSKPTLIDAKADLIVGTGADAASRLAVGSNGDTIVADSAASTGLRWQGSITSGKNFIINGGFDIWQRGTSGFSTSNGTYTADRWQNSSNNLTITRDTDVPTAPYFNYSMKMVGTAANSVIQRIESANSTLLAGQNITVSFYAKRTSGTGNLDVRFYYPTATDNFASVTQIGSTVVLSASPSSSWTRYSTTVAIGTNVTAGLQILINNDTSSGGTTFITGVQLELGSVATTFSRASGTIQGELAACQRYYYRNTPGVIYGFQGQSASARSTTQCDLALRLPVTMRVAPTSVDYSALEIGNYIGSTSYAVTAASLASNNNNSNYAAILFTIGTANFTAGTRYDIFNNNNTAGYLGVSAEL